jgi:hypothetical protein
MHGRTRSLLPFFPRPRKCKGQGRIILHNQANVQITVNPCTAEIRIEGDRRPPPPDDLPSNRRYCLLWGGSIVEDNPVLRVRRVGLESDAEALASLRPWQAHLDGVSADAFGCAPG